MLFLKIILLRNLLALLPLLSFYLSNINFSFAQESCMFQINFAGLLK